MVLFRFSTYLQSLVRLEPFDANLSQMALETLKVLLREPLDARNRMIQDESEDDLVEIREDTNQKVVVAEKAPEPSTRKKMNLFRKS
jgi:hypothetical protein